ncbi:reverse transcriptase domain-containing protein [Tanacetum coccineum]
MDRHAWTEYEALIAGLRIAARMGVRNLEANVDSRLVANHVLGEYVAKEDNMIQYLDNAYFALGEYSIGFWFFDEKIRQYLSFHCGAWSIRDVRYVLKYTYLLPLKTS